MKREVKIPYCESQIKECLCNLWEWLNGNDTYKAFVASRVSCLNVPLSDGGFMPLPEYMDYTAFTYGYDNYKELVSDGYDLTIPDLHLQFMLTTRQQYGR